MNYLKPTEKIQSVKEQETPLYTDNYESLKEKEAEEAKKKAAAAATPVLAETKNVQEPQPLNTPPATETAAVAAPIPVISPSNPAPTPEKGEEKEEEEKESDKEDSSKKSSKKKKKKHSKKKKKDKKKKSSSKKKKKKKHQDKKVEEEEEDKKEVEEDEKKKKVDEPVIVYPYSLTPPSTKTSKMKYLYEKGLTTRLNDELMMTENGKEEEQQLVEAETQVMSVKTNVNNLEQPQSLLKSDKTQFAKTNATTKLLTGIENEEKQIKSSKTSLLNVKNGNELPFFSARGLYDGEQLELPKPGPNEEQLSPSKSREPPPSPVLQSPIGKNGILMATLGPADRTLTPAKDDANPPSKLQSHLVLAPEKQNEAAPKTLTILNPVNGGSLAVTNQIKAPLLTNESKAKSDWKSFLEAAPVMSTKFDLQPQGGDEAAADMPSKIEELQKTQKSTTNNTLKPKIMTQSDKAKNIAKYGLKCSPAEYPTFGDILSDWSTVDGVVTAAKMKEIDEKEIRRRKVMEQQQQKDAAVANAAITKKENKDEEKLQQQPKKSKQEIPKEKIAKGEVMRKKHEYPTMNDVVSDWE
uniref:Uncharacterized protein n=1 Tax=Panagrolaimus sp. ES5 TaxID=591445 RepID=A0AC34FYH4_9BILA